MALSARNQTPILAAVRKYWIDFASEKGSVFATRQVVKAFWEFLRDSTPSRLRQRFGDADYDWEHRVNTTSGAVGWHDRVLGAFHSAYQPTEPEVFREMLDTLQQLTSLKFANFTFVDLGSGKGRTLLMAADYPFRRIIGVELLPSLNRIARQNLAEYKSRSQKCFAIECVCADATTYRLPNEPLLVYLFNPFPEPGLRRVLANLNGSLGQQPRQVHVIYHNPEHERVLRDTVYLKKIGGTHQYSIFTTGT